jgi:hypothetical protein
MRSPSNISYRQCRRIERYDYHLSRLALVLGAMVVSFVGCHYAGKLGVVWSLVTPAFVWIAWAVALFYATAWNQLRVPRLATSDLAR